jgi:hypothetical protein
LAVRAQAAGEARIGTVEAEGDDLVEQPRRPHVRIVREALTEVADVRPERVLAAAGALAGDAAAGQVGADGLAVMAEVPGDRADRLALPAERVRVHIVLPCEHAGRDSFEVLVEVRDRDPRRGPASRDGRHAAGARGGELQ